MSGRSNMMQSCVVVVNGGESLRRRSQPGSKESQTNHSTQDSTNFTRTHSAQTVCDHKHGVLMVGGASGGGVMGGDGGGRGYTTGEAWSCLQPYLTLGLRRRHEERIRAREQTEVEKEALGRHAHSSRISGCACARLPYGCCTSTVLNTIM